MDGQQRPCSPALWTRMDQKRARRDRPDPERSKGGLCRFGKQRWPQCVSLTYACPSSQEVLGRKPHTRVAADVITLRRYPGGPTAAEGCGVPIELVAWEWGSPVRELAPTRSTALGDAGRRRHPDTYSVARHPWVGAQTMRVAGEGERRQAMPGCHYMSRAWRCKCAHRRYPPVPCRTPCPPFPLLLTMQGPPLASASGSKGHTLRWTREERSHSRAATTLAVLGEAMELP